MATFTEKERSIKIALSFLRLSIFLMIIVLPGVYTGTIPNDYNPKAVIAIILALIIRFVFYNRYRSILKRLQNGDLVRKRTYVIIGILLMFFSLIYSDGAFSYLNNKNVLYISYLMFGSVISELLAAIMTIAAALYNSHKLN